MGNQGNIFGVMDVCIECGCKFLRGLYPQKKCDFCSSKESYIWFLTKK